MKRSLPRMSVGARSRRLFAEALEQRILLTTVTNVIPAANAYDAHVAADISATFDENIDPTSTTPRTFVVHSQRTATAFVVSASGNSVTARPASDFAAGELIQVTATANIRGDSTPVAPRVWQFRTASMGSGQFVESDQDIGSAVRVSFGDLDGDSDIDAISQDRGDPLRMWINDGTGAFTLSSRTLPTSAPTLGDVDGDGDLDGVSARYVFLNNGNAEFTDTGQNLVGSSNSNWLELGDLDGDGDLDVVHGVNYAGMRVWFNNGQGVFTNSGQILGNDFAEKILLGDLDGDGDLDVVSRNFNDPELIWLNDGSGTFLADQMLNDDGGSLEVGDVDGDGDLDLVSCDSNGHVWLNDGNAAFTNSGRFLTQNSADCGGLALGDLDGDGDLDVFGRMRVFVNDGGGNFSDSGQITALARAGFADLADVDGDGDLDAWQPAASPSTSRLWINESVEPLVTLSVDNSTIAESAATASITAAIDTVSDQDITVELEFTGTAESDDFTVQASQIVIPSGSTAGSVAVSSVNDALDEADETLIIDVVGVTNAQESGTQQVTVTITDDDDPPSGTLTVDQSTIDESNGIATFTATLSELSGRDVMFGLSLSGSATVSEDYTLADLQIVVPAGVTSNTTQLSAVQDFTDELDETVIVDVVDVANAIPAGPQQLTVTIVDDDAPPLVSLDVDHSSIVEAGGVATVSIALSAPSSFPVTVDLDFTGSATLGTDYVLSATQVVLAPGATSGFITVTSVADGLITEGPESIVVDIASATYATEDGDQRVSTTIIDDVNGPGVTLSVDQHLIAEPGGVAIVTATLDWAFSMPVTVDLEFRGTASVSDYAVATTQLVIEPGETTGTLIVAGVDDMLIEGDETVLVDIGVVINGKEPDEQQVSITISDDELPPSVTLSLDNSEIPEGGGSARLTATLSSESTIPVTVELGLSGTATADDDFTISNTQIVIQPGEVSGSVTVSAVQDELDEPDETVIVDLLAVSNGRELVVQQLSTTIIDDDEPPTVPTVSISVDANAIPEAAGTATITVSLSQAVEEPVTVDLAVAGTAIALSDYIISATQVVVAPGATFGTVVVNAVHDVLPEGDETVIVDIVAATNADVGEQQVTITIEDDDAQPAVSLLLFNAMISENAGATQLTAFLSGISGVPVTVSLEYTGTATHGEDFDAPTEIVIPAGGLNATIAIRAIQDVIDEGNETIVTNIAAVTGATGSGSETITIIDDDVTPSVTLSIAELSRLESIGQAIVTAFLSTTASVPVTVNLDYSGGTATLQDDFTAATQLVIPAGGLNGSVIIRFVQDTLDEADETVSVEISSVINATYAGQKVTTTILDDDPPPAVSLSVDTGTISEANGAAVVTATLSEVSGQVVTVDLELTGTATLDQDYHAQTALVVPVGSTTGAVTVTAVPDAVDEPDETVVLSVRQITNAVPTGPQQAAVTIIDDEPLGLVVTELVPTSTGFVARFSEQLDAGALNLYGAESAQFGVPDVELAGRTGGLVTGSLVVSPTRQTITFIKTTGLLAADTYTVTLRSGANGFSTPAGLLLDGDANGIVGDDLEQTFTINSLDASTVILSIPDIVRGAGQDVNLPADTAQGIPVSISEGSSVQTATVQIGYDPDLIEISGAIVAEDIPAAASLALSHPTAGLMIITLISPVSLPAGASTLFYLQAHVPAAAASGQTQILDIHGTQLSNGSGNPMPSVDDDALHLTSYFADVSGNGRINAADAAQVARVAALLDAGFATSPLADPRVVGDVSGNGRVNAADASLVARFAALFDVPQIPPIPVGLATVGPAAVVRVAGLPGSRTEPTAGRPPSNASSTSSSSSLSTNDPEYPAVDSIIGEVRDFETEKEESAASLEDAIDELFSTWPIDEG